MAKVKTSEEFFNEFLAPVEPTPEVPVVENEKVEQVEDVHEEEIELEGSVDQESDEEVTTEAEESSDNEEADGGEEKQVEDEDGIIFVDDEQEVVEEVDYVKLSRELGFEGIKNKDQFLQKYNTDVAKAKEDALEGLPTTLQEAIKFSRDGGDFMAILDASSIDYDKVPNLELVEAKYQKYFKDENGSFDRESFEDWVAGEGKAKINMLADQIRTQEKQIQTAKIDSIKQKTAQDREKLNAELKSELDRIDSIGGVKLTQAQKDSMYRDTVSGLATEELFYEGGKISNKKVAQNLFKVRMFDKAIQIAKTSAKNEGKRDVISRATNASVQRRADRPTAEIKKVSPMDQFYEILTSKK